MEAPPDPILRPKLAHFMWARGLRLKDLEAPTGRSHEYIRRVCLPFSDPARTVPDDEFIGRVEAYTAGEVSKADFEATP